MIKGVIFGLVRCYYEQNSDKKDFMYFTNLLFTRLVSRGWDPSYIGLIFYNAIHKAKYQPENQTNFIKKILLKRETSSSSTSTTILQTSHAKPSGKSIKKSLWILLLKNYTLILQSLSATAAQKHPRHCGKSYSISSGRKRSQ